MQRFVVQSAQSRDSGGKPFLKRFTELFSYTVGDMSVFSRVAFVLLTAVSTFFCLMCSLFYYYFVFSNQ